MNLIRSGWIVLPALIVFGCDTMVPESDPPQHEVLIDFSSGPGSWEGSFSDYPPAMGERMDLVAEHRVLPPELDGQGFYIAGTNHSDDLFMFLRSEVVGLSPATPYDVAFQVTFASEVAQGCVGIGGSPGESVYMKAGAAAVRPVAKLVETGHDPDGYYQMNVDKGGQAFVGSDAVMLGTIGNTTAHCLEPAWELITLESDAPLTVSTDADGKLWLFVGTDSGFEGRTRLYYASMRVTFDEVRE
jgi:hypothetical protein